MAIEMQRQLNMNGPTRPPCSEGVQRAGRAVKEIFTYALFVDRLEAWLPSLQQRSNFISP